MIRLPIQTLVDFFGANAVEAPEGEFCGVTIDSRKSCEGQLFVAIKGDNFDGHSFVEKAYQNGAVLALVEHPVDTNIDQIVVKDSRESLAQLATYWRHQCNPCVIALTGSNGKTTVKEMLHQILAKKAHTLATRGNFNNDIGVPLTLFEISPEDEFAIIEMGANHIGEIAMLAEIAQPDVVYVNNVAASHLTGFGDVKGVIKAKGELYQYCKAQHKALFNADEMASQQWKKICAANTQLSCALDNEADVIAKWEAQDDRLNIIFRYRDSMQSCEMLVLGEHSVRNALAAVSLALLAGIDFQQAVEGLNGFSGVKGRLQMMKGPKQSRLINDSYNANPSSLEAGIKVLCTLKGSPWLALGDMGELGDEAEALHKEVAITAKRYGVEKFFGVGKLSCLATDEFGEAGYCFEDIETMSKLILDEIHQGVNLLIKGSRSAGMEKLVETLTASMKGRDVNVV